jgi:uncharacterized membrane protein
MLVAGECDMATVVGKADVRINPIVVTWSDKLLAGVAGFLLLMVSAAIARGHSEWQEIPGNVWAHITTIYVALALTPLMLLRRRGDRLHRRLGYVWVVAMALTAALTFDLHLINPGSYSFIHILSGWTLIQVPLIVIRARQHDIVRHRRAVRGMVIGALLVAGFFTFPFGRLMGNWLFG